MHMHIDIYICNIEEKRKRKCKGKLVMGSNVSYELVHTYVRTCVNVFLIQDDKEKTACAEVISIHKEKGAILAYNLHIYFIKATGL